MKIKSLFVSAGLSLTVALSTPTLVLAHDTATWSASTTNKVIDSVELWRNIRSATVTITDSRNHTCMAIGSADMKNKTPVGTNSKYRFTITHNTLDGYATPWADRTLELFNYEGDDFNSLPVTTNLTFSNIRNDNGVHGSGVHTFYFLGRKNKSDDADAPILDSSFSVICVDGV